MFLFLVNYIYKSSAEIEVTEDDEDDADSDVASEYYYYYDNYEGNYGEEHFDPENYGDYFEGFGKGYIK